MHTGRPVAPYSGEQTVSTGGSLTLAERRVRQQPAQDVRRHLRKVHVVRVCCDIFHRKMQSITHVL